MKGLIIKDLLTVVKHRYIQCIAILAVMLMAVLFSDMSTIYLFVPVLLSTLVTNSIQMDEISRFPNYAETLPVSKKQIVGAKYLFTVTLGLIASVPFTLVGSILLERNDEFSVNNVLVLFAGAMIIIILLTSLAIPLYLRFGCALANTLYLITIGILFGIITAFFTQNGFTVAQMLEKCIDILHNPLPWVILGILCVGILAFLSYQIAYRLYQSKEA